jgi:hypothetical protein
MIVILHLVVTMKETSATLSAGERQNDIVVIPDLNCRKTEHSQRLYGFGIDGWSRMHEPSCQTVNGDVLKSEVR